MSLLISLSTSSFFLSRHLTQQLQLNQYSVNQLKFSVEQNNPFALIIAIKQTKRHSQSWLVLAKKLANTHGEYAFQLGVFFQSTEQQSRAVFWFNQGVKLDYLPAKVALAQLYFTDEQYLLAQQVLLNLSLESNEVLQLKIKLAIAQGDRAFVDNNWQKLNSNKNNESQELIKDIIQFQILSTVDLSNKASVKVCSASVQLFATNLADLNKTQQLLKSLKQMSLNDQFCFASIRYIPLPELACAHKKEQAIKCDESQWGNYEASIDSRFIGVMVPKGGANVHLGILYIDAKDNINVFSHELTHLLGFIDEYPLPINHQKCAQTQSQPFSPNVAVLPTIYYGKQHELREEILKQLPWRDQISKSTPILQKNGKGWLLGTPDKFDRLIGVFPAKSCDLQVKQLANLSVNNHNHNHIQAFKPVSVRTHLEYFEQPLPNSYLALIKQHESKYLMPSFHYNIALAAMGKSDYPSVNLWLKKSTKWEISNGRKKRINQLNF